MLVKTDFLVVRYKYLECGAHANGGWKNLNKCHNLMCTIIWSSVLVDDLHVVS